MPWIQVPESKLTPEKDYALTHVGCKSAMGKNVKDRMKTVTIPIYKGATVMKTVQAEICTPIILPPTSKGNLAKNYATWWRLDQQTKPGYKDNKPPKLALTPFKYMRRAYYAGPGVGTSHTFTQQRNFGSGEAPLYKPDERKIKKYVSDEEDLLTNYINLKEWIVWEQSKSAKTRRSSKGGGSRKTVRQ